MKRMDCRVKPGNDESLNALDRKHRVQPAEGK
ncbi:MAG: hypothetical protein QOD29_1930 [Alphaproteobacteria bacterium]|jgi:hypothetical protein|nr:hypothetical protein [Alphaproteobacteria bacterium]